MLSKCQRVTSYQVCDRTQPLKHIIVHCILRNEYVINHIVINAQQIELKF